jgi:hypothetical protein
VTVWTETSESETLSFHKNPLFNAQRQHRDPLLQARTVLRRFEIEKQRPRGKLQPGDEAEARDRIGRIVGGDSG